jgi:hypothetical protein
VLDRPGNPECEVRREAVSTQAARVVVLLGSWLIATGILHLVPRVSFSGSGEILAGLAIAAVVLLLLDR